MSLKIGEKAPNFSLLSSKMEKISLENYKGKNVLLLFFPLAGSGGCTKEMCSIRDDYKKYEELNAQVLGVSVDNPFALQMWAEKNNYTFTLLSDFNKETAKSYGAMYDVFLPGKFDFNGVAKRSAFVIGKDGTIKYAEILENPADEPNYSAILEILK